MRITRSDDRRFVIVDFPWLYGLVFFPCAALMLGVSVIAVAKGRGASQVAGPIIATLMFFAGGAVFTKRCEFDFDLVAKQLTWRRRGLFTNVGGVVPFEQIRHASVQARNGHDGGMTYRVALATDDGPLPLTESYSLGDQAKCDEIREKINALLNVASTAAQQLENDILELARAGRKLDAIALARKRYGYDLAQAKQFVDGLTA